MTDRPPLPPFSETEQPPVYTPLPLLPVLPLTVQGTPPTLEALGHFANRWLKRLGRPAAQRDALLALLARHAPASGLPWEQQPTATLMHAVGQLWQRTTGPSDEALDRACLLFTLARQCQQTPAASWWDTLRHQETALGLSGLSYPQASVLPAALLAQWFATHPWPWSALIQHLKASHPSPDPHVLAQRWPWLAQWQTYQTACQTVIPAYPAIESPWSQWFQWLADALQEWPLALPGANAVVHPVDRLVLVEGLSDAVFVNRLLASYGPIPGTLVQTIDGKNKVAERYAYYRDWCANPIIILLDADARTQWQEWAQATLRPQDRLFIWPDGALEETYPADWVASVLNQTLPVYPLLTEETVAGYLQDQSHGPTAFHRLEALLQERNLGSLDKPGFARHLAQWVGGQRPPLPPVMNQLLETIRQGPSPDDPSHIWRQCVVSVQ